MLNNKWRMTYIDVGIEFVVQFKTTFILQLVFL